MRPFCRWSKVGCDTFRRASNTSSPATVFPLSFERHATNFFSLSDWLFTDKRFPLNNLNWQPPTERKTSLDSMISSGRSGSFSASSSTLFVLERPDTSHSFQLHHSFPFGPNISIGFIIRLWSAAPESATSISRQQTPPSILVARTTKASALVAQLRSTSHVTHIRPFTFETAMAGHPTLARFLSAC